MTIFRRGDAWWGSLAARITAVTATVAIVAVLTTGLVAGQLLRSAAQAQAREVLGRQADALASLSPQSLLVLASERQVFGSDGTRLVLITRDGAVRGGSGEVILPSLVARLIDGGSVSTTTEIGGTDVLVEGRQLSTGGAALLTRPVVEVDRVTDRLRRRVGLALAAGLGIAAVAGLLLAGRITRPLQRTAAIAHRLARGERRLDVPRGGGREVAEVATSLAALDAALATSEGRQREFLLSVSHDLRTPLTAIRGYAEALADGMVANSEIADVGQTLSAEAGRLDRFVNDLLTLARLDSDDFRIDPAPVDLCAVVSDVHRAWTGQARHADVDLQAVIPDEPLVVITDGSRVRQVLDALVENAIRAVPSGGKVVITARPGLSVDLIIQDDGPGLDDADLAVVFERGALRTRHAGDRAGGTGLGLSIVARLVSRLGGEVSASRGPDGVGAAFVVSFPRDPLRL